MKHSNAHLVQLVLSPNQTVPGQTVWDAWNKRIDTMGSGSDFTAFQDFAGIPSISMAFGASKNSAIYHYHSNYDSFDWMRRFGDKGFEYHATIAKVWALVAAKLVETPVLQLKASSYAIAVSRYIEAIKEKAFASGLKHLPGVEEGEDPWLSLDNAVSHFIFASIVHDGTADQLLDDYYHLDIPWWQPWKKAQLYYAIRQVNNKYKYLERKFLYAEGLDGRPWFKHIVFAPGKWTGYAGATFPGLVEGFDENNDDIVVKWVGITTKAIEAAADWLED